MKQDTLDMALLYDFYGELLTEKQRRLFDLYYNQDYSLGEIAENECISRQGVHDAIARAEAALRDYEDKLHAVSRYRETGQALRRIGQLAQQLNTSPDPAACMAAEQILAVIESIKE